MTAKATLYVYGPDVYPRYFVHYYIVTSTGPENYPIRGSGGTGRKEYDTRRGAIAAVNRYKNRMLESGLKWGGMKEVKK